jgi:hypothetical protein
LPFPDLNWTGRLINKDGSSKEINLVPDKVSNENINLLLRLMVRENGWECQIQKNRLRGA